MSRASAPVRERSEEILNSGARVSLFGVHSLSPAEFLPAFAIAAAAAIAVFLHAERNHIRWPSAWGSFVFLFLIVGLPAYAIHIHRTRRRRRTGPD